MNFIFANGALLANFKISNNFGRSFCLIFDSVVDQLSTANEKTMEFGLTLFMAFKKTKFIDF